MSRLVCILDYGSGNVKSVANLLHFLKVDHMVSNQADDLRRASHLLLPGVGAFGAAMERIRERIPMAELERQVLEGRKPFLGICVGMQVLAGTGEEFGHHRGLGWIPGRVRRFQERGLPIPHIGWNEACRRRPQSLLGEHERLDFYFVHSYVFEPESAAHVEAVTEYGETFPSIVRRDNICGVQFHPEKSQKAGMLVMSRFLES